MSDAVAIIGAGPAGLSTAHFLAKAGIRHILIDRANFPRDKVCGESYDGKVYHTLRRIHTDLPQRMQDLGILRADRRYQMVVDGAPPLPVVFSEGATPRLQGTRRAFDDFLLLELLKKGLTTWMPGTKVSQYESSAAGWRLRLSNGARLSVAAVVFAAGSKATNPFLPRPSASKGELLFYRMHLRCPAEEGEENGIEFHLQNKPVPVCLSLCPLNGGIYNVEVGIRRRDYPELGQPLSMFLENAVSTLDERFRNAEEVGRGAGISMQLHRYSGSLSGQRWLVAGSAAVQVNPITGMGVGNAMRMGELAAELIVEQYQRSDSWSLLAYDARVRQVLRQEIRFSRLVTWLQHRQPLLRPVMRGLARTKRVQHWLQQPDLVQRFSDPAFYRRK